MRPRRVLVTNDDGIDAPGLRVLVSGLAEAGIAELLVVAPNRNYSGAGTSMMTTDADIPRREIGYEQRTLVEAPDAEAYAIDGPPALCAMVAMRGGFGPTPDLVVSGINFGLNTGPAIPHSGTVAAARTAARAGAAALAVSAGFTWGDEDSVRYDTAAAVALELLAERRPDDGRAFSLNVPPRSRAELAGVVSAPPAKTASYRAWVDRGADSLVLNYQADDSQPVDADTDTALLRAGFATVSAFDQDGWTDCSDLTDRLNINVA